MKKKLITLILFVTINFLPNIVFAETLIVYIDLEKIVATSKAGVSIKKQVEKIHKNNITKFQKYEKTLKEEETKIIAKKNILNKDDFEAEIKNLREKAKTYRKERNDSINDLNKKRLDATNQLFKTLNPILAQYSNDKSISLIIQKKNIIIGKSELDITDTILKLLNKNIKDIKIK
jgi:outer membrane protein